MEDKKEVESTGFRLKTDYYIPQSQTKKAALALILICASAYMHVRSFMKDNSTEKVATQAQTSADYAQTKFSEIDLIKAELQKTNEKVKKYSEALESWTDFFQEEETRQRTVEGRKRYKDQRLRIREILRPVSQDNNDLRAFPMFPRMIPMRGLSFDE